MTLRCAYRKNEAEAAHVSKVLSWDGVRLGPGGGTALFERAERREVTEAERALLMDIDMSAPVCGHLRRLADAIEQRKCAQGSFETLDLDNPTERVWAGRGKDMSWG